MRRRRRWSPAARHSGGVRATPDARQITRNVAFDKGDPYALIEAVDPKWQGALPHSILVAPGGEVSYRSEGAFDTPKLRKAIVGWLGRYYHSTPGGK